MLEMEGVEAGARVTHRNTGLRYAVVDVGEEEVLLSPESTDLQDLMVPTRLFREEFVLSDRYSVGRGRARGGRPRRPPVARAPSGPKVQGKIKKLVRERGFGFVRGDDGKEVFFHRSGLGSTDYDALSEGDTVEYVGAGGSARRPRRERPRDRRELGGFSPR